MEGCAELDSFVLKSYDACEDVLRALGCSEADADDVMNSWMATLTMTWHEIAHPVVTAPAVALLFYLRLLRHRDLLRTMYRGRHTAAVDGQSLDNDDAVGAEVWLGQFVASITSTERGLVAAVLAPWSDHEIAKALDTPSISLAADLSKTCSPLARLSEPGTQDLLTTEESVP